MKGWGFQHNRVVPGFDIHSARGGNQEDVADETDMAHRGPIAFFVVCRGVLLHPLFGAFRVSGLGF